MLDVLHWLSVWQHTNYRVVFRVWQCQLGQWSCTSLPNWSLLAGVANPFALLTRGLWWSHLPIQRLFRTVHCLWWTGGVLRQCCPTRRPHVAHRQISIGPPELHNFLNLCLKWGKRKIWLNTTKSKQIKYQWCTKPVKSFKVYGCHHSALGLGMVSLRSCTCSLDHEQEHPLRTSPIKRTFLTPIPCFFPLTPLAPKRDIP